MQKEMKVCSFATAYMGFKQAHELQEDVVGNLIDFKDYMLENGLKIDEKDMLKELYIVGKQVQENEKNKENEMENGKNEEKKMTILEKIVGGRFLTPAQSEMMDRLNPESTRERKKSNRFFVVFAVVLMLYLSVNKLYGSDTNVVYDTYLPIYCSNGDIVLDYAEAMKLGDVRKQVDYLQTVLLETERFAKKQEELERIEKMMERYTRMVDGKRYLCVPQKGGK